MTEMTVAQIKRKRAVYLALSTITLLLLGLIYAFSMFAAPMCATFGLEKSAVSLTFNIMMIAFCLGGVAGAQIEKKLGTKTGLICSGILFFIGFAGTGLFGTGQIMVLYILYGVCGGAGVGIGYNCIIATTNIWFPDRVGFSSGVLLMGFGVSALILGNISLQFIPSVGLTAVLIALGVVTLAITIVCAAVLRRPPENIVEIMTGKRAAVAAAPASDPADNEKILATPALYIFWVWSVIIIAIGLATIGNCASDAQEVGLSASLATLLVGLVSTSNGLARLIMGAVYDKTGIKFTMALDAVVAVVAAGSILGAFLANIGVLYVIGALCCGFCYGTVPMVHSAFARQRYGQKNYAFNLSIVNLGIVLGSVLNIVIGMAVGGTANRLAIFVVLAVLAVIALVDTAPFSKLWNRDLKRLDEARAAAE